MRAIIASAWHSKARLYEVLKPGSKAPREIRPTTNSSGSTGYQSLASTNAGEDALFHVRHESSGRIIFGELTGGDRSVGRSLGFRTS
ncbi:hypothetical protein IWQ60_011686 [Tieghemiomyces parasiticus]|uniref:Uncharacterized protein n=1 Tax=Tieghemiomyces parasiticus TaxID=78921 RepID=A0A9W7ZNI1_9FUNG|nr:hypothetical protein IWQ60_011686 [Tieghemiomyces parasiticus]